MPVQLVAPYSKRCAIGMQPAYLARVLPLSGNIRDLQRGVASSHCFCQPYPCQIHPALSCCARVVLLLYAGWQYEGPLYVARSPEVDGPVWECPVLIELNPQPLPPPQHGNQPISQPDPPSSTTAGQPSSSNIADMPGVPYSGADSTAEQHTHLFSASVGTFPSVYWSGRYREGRFDLENAAGPYPLDLGDILYAPNVLTNKQVGSVMCTLYTRFTTGGSDDSHNVGDMCIYGTHICARRCCYLAAKYAAGAPGVLLAEPKFFRASHKTSIDLDCARRSVQLFMVVGRCPVALAPPYHHHHLCLF
jgi:hypothetical protein